MKILFIKTPSLIREGVVEIVKSELVSDEVKAYSPMEQEQVYKELADLVIIDLDTTVDVFSIINYYLEKNKKIIVWTLNSEKKGSLIDLFKMNLHGYLYGMDRTEFILSINYALNGRAYIHKELHPILLGDYRRKHSNTTNRPEGLFTDREWEVLELLIKGYSNEKMGKYLYLSEKTIKNYVSSLLKKLNVRDRTNLVITALKNEWFYIYR